MNLFPIRLQIGMKFNFLSGPMSKPCTNISESKGNKICPPLSLSLTHLGDTTGAARWGLRVQNTPTYNTRADSITSTPAHYIWAGRHKENWPWCVSEIGAK